MFQAVMQAAQSLAVRMMCASMVVLALGACGGGGGGGGSDTPDNGPVAGADYFPLAVGNRWAYQSGAAVSLFGVDATRTVAGRTVFVVVSSDADGGSEELYEKAASGVRFVAPSGGDALDGLLDGVPVLRLHLVAGDSVQVLDVALPNVGDLDGDGRADSIQVRVQYTTVGFGPLTTPAGNWNGVAQVRTVLTQVVSLSAGNQQLTTTATSDDWYAPNVGPVRNDLVVTDASGTRRETLVLSAYRAGTLRSESVAPAVQATTPAAGNLQGNLFGIGVTFSEVMYLPSLNAGGFTLTGPDGRVVAGTLSGSGAALQFTAQGTPLTGTYTAAVTAAAQDLAGNAVAAPRSWSFAVDATGPSVVAVSPADGASEVALGTAIRITFDEAPDPASLPGQLRLFDVTQGSEMALTLQQQGSTVTLIPTQPLDPRRTYRVNVGINVRDAVGNFTAGDFNSSFRSDPGRFGYVGTFDLPGSGVVYPFNVGAAVAFGDVDGDGRGDVLVGAAASFEAPGQPLFWVWRMQADGQLRTPLRVEPPPGYAQACSNPALAVLDFDGDGRLDVVAGSSCGLALYRQGAGGVLALREVLPAPNLLRMRAADMNGDGRIDLVGIAWNDNEAWVWTQRPEGGFGPRVGHAVDYFGWTTLALGDYNGDSRPDIVITGANTATQALALLPQRADGSFGPPGYAAVDPVWGAAGAAVGDLDGDGRNDVVTGTFGGGANLWLFRQRSDGSLAPPAPLDISSPPTALVVADLNNDGRSDLVVAYRGAVVVYEQQPNGTPGPRIRLPGLGELDDRNTHGVLVADINGDGLPDIVANERYLLQRPTGASAGVAQLPQGRLHGLQRLFTRALRPAPAPPTSTK